jgi:hydroxyethylthiazole kinase-like uncharacterized protein yjeF
MEIFQEEQLKELYKPKPIGKGNNGQVVVIGGSSLFHGAPLLALKTASRIVDMVFFTSPEPSLAETTSHLKANLNSFIWFPFDQLKDYLLKADAILIGPGLLRYHDESKSFEYFQKKLCDQAGQETKKITEDLLAKFPQKQWIIDAGSLQVMDPKNIPSKAILTPNSKEYKMLFADKIPQQIVKEHDCILVFKNAATEIFSPTEEIMVKGGNYGMIKGGTGDVLAGLTLALAAKNPPFLAAAAASFVVKKTADELYKKFGFAYNADDLAEKVPEVLGSFWR